MTKHGLRILERVFDAEIHGRLPFQSKSKEVERMCDEGWLEPTEQKFGPYVTVRGFTLTHAGRIAYCESCKDTLEGECE